MRFRISVIRVRHLLSALLVAAFSIANVPFAPACPFCTTIQPTLSQRREQAQIVAIAECLESSATHATFRVHQLLKGQGRLNEAKLARLTIPRLVPLKQGALAILFAEAADDQFSWTYEPTNELGVGYFAQSPSLRVPAAERLRYFVRFLEHADPLAAEDAFNEFGHAPYDVVQQVADRLPADSLRRWLADAKVPDERKGFYGLALGLAGQVKDGPAQEAFLRQLMEKPASDFRAGYDGILGGYLVLTGERGLEWIERHLLADANARVGDVRHAMSALRFYQEFGKEIPTSRLSQAMRHLLSRPEFAAAAIIDLARWQDWQSREQIVQLYKATPPPAAATRRAIIGYLLNCPLPEASADLAELRRLDPRGVGEAEKLLSSANGLRTD